MIHIPTRAAQWAWAQTENDSVSLSLSAPYKSGGILNRTTPLVEENPVRIVIYVLSNHPFLNLPAPIGVGIFPKKKKKTTQKLAL